jgi:D-amino-acid dehydrogenase
MRVVVIGSGVLGVTSAYFLAQNGAEVTVLDRAEAPAQGTSFANAGMLTPSMADPWNTPGVFKQLLHYLGKEDAPLLLRARALPSIFGWGIAFLANSRVGRFHAHMAANLRLANYSLETLRALRRDLALSYDEKTAGTLRVFREHSALDASAARWETLAGFGLKVNILSADATVALEPALAEVREKLVGGIHCPQDESGDARQFTQALAEKARAAGVGFRFGTAVTGFTHDGRKISAVVTDQGPLTADAVVMSAGSWSAPLLQTLGLRLPVRPVKGYSITLDTGTWGLRPQQPVIDDSLHAAITPLGRRLRVAGTAEFAGYDTALSPARIENLFSLLLNIYPGFAPHLNRSQAQPWAGLRPVSADGVPFIGRLRYENLFLNTGHGHLGWTLAAGSARLLADLMTNKAPEIDAAAYAADRG